MMKAAIKDQSVFDGLAVDDREKYTRLFMRPEFKLQTFRNAATGEAGHVIYEVWNGGFVFHLVNFTKMKTRRMTEKVLRDFVLPLCERLGLSFVQANVERDGMARKLEKSGFRRVSGNCYRLEL